MPNHRDASARLGAPDSWFLLAADSTEASGLSSTPLTVVGFFGCWVGLGVALALGLARRGHERPTMVTLGAGLGPLMLVVASDAVRHRERAARPLVVRSAADLGGGLHVLLLVQGSPEEAGTLEHTVRAMRSDLASVRVARVVTYESIDGAVDPETVLELAEPLRLACERLAVDGTGIELHPGTTETVVDRFVARFPQSLVLFAVDRSDPTTSPRRGR